MLRNGSNVEVLNFSVSGATCSNALYPRQLTAANGSEIALPAVDQQITTFRDYNATLMTRLNYTALIFIGVSGSFTLNKVETIH